MSHFLCDNPLTDNPDGVTSFIYRYPKPGYFACLREINLLSKTSVMLEEVGYNIGFMYKDPNDCVKLFYIVIIKQHDRSGEEVLVKALRETVNWYASCLRKSNPVGGAKTDGYMLLKDYNRHTPGLQILHVPKMGRFILSFKMGITSFSDTESLFRFCIEVLGYTQQQLTIKGEITTIKM